MKAAAHWGVWMMVLTVGGCVVGPNYTPPDVQTPAQWSGLQPSGATGEHGVPATQPTADPTDVAAWWKNLNDPTLDSLIARAAESNLDLRIATARVREARAQRSAAASSLWPQIGLSGSYRYSGSSLNAGAKSSGGTGLLKDARNTALSSAARSILAGQGVDAGQIASGAVNQIVGKVIDNRLTGGDQPSHRGQNLFQAGFDASWEIDVFGGAQRGLEAAEADIEASEEDRRTLIVSLVSEVALNYVQLRGYQQRLDIALRNIESQQSTVELTQERLAAGFASQLEVAQAKTQLATTTSQVPMLQDGIRQTLYHLSVLLGQQPDALVAELDQAEAIPASPPAVPVGLPSDLLRRRPDVRSAERQLAAATARIGEAIAELFPKFSLTGSFGSQSRNIDNLFSCKSLGWAVGPAVSWPIFQGGRIRANIEAQNARQEQALATYEQTVLIALKEVEIALSAYSNEQIRRESLKNAVQASRQATELSTELYTWGRASFLDLLEAQRALYSSEDALVQSDMAVVTDLIALYKALGGGWEG